MGYSEEVHLLCLHINEYAALQISRLLCSCLCHTVHGYVPGFYVKEQQHLQVLSMLRGTGVAPCSLSLSAESARD